jgi:hypothetical protein
MSLNYNVKNNAIPIMNTSNYSNTFKYANYNLDDKMKITSPQELGLCGNPEYKKKLNEAADILFKDTTYFKDGTFIENFSNKVPDSRYTDAVQDTSDGIRTNLQNELLYAEKQENLSNTNKNLNEMIYEYEIKRENLKRDEQLYVPSGIHASNKNNAPRILKKRIMDNNELYLTTKLLFTLGTVTATTLIIFAVILARD